MRRIKTQQGRFVHPYTYESLTSLDVVIVDPGILSRNYYGSDSELKCWSSNCDFPDEAVLASNKQALRCLDCSKSIKNAGVGGRAACKFFTKVKVAFLSEECLYEIRLGALSLFSKEDNKMSLYKYVAYLERNQEHIGNVLTEIYFVQHRNFYKMFFKPVRPLTEEELANIQQTKETEEIFMANQSHIIKNVTARYPRLDQPYKFDRKAGANGKSVPCDATVQGSSYDLDFVMDKAQAKELHELMQDAYTNAPGRDKSWPKKLEINFKKLDDGTFAGKTTRKASYDGVPTSPPLQFDAKNKALGSDFMLTTGSIVNIAVEFIPYKIEASGATGVSLRLRGVQVLNYVPYKAPSPFDEEDGFTADQDSSNPFESVDAEVKEKPEADPFDDEEEVKEPVKRKKKKDDDDDEDDIEDIIANWGDED